MKNANEFQAVTEGPVSPTHRPQHVAIINTFAALGDIRDMEDVEMEEDNRQNLEHVCEENLDIHDEEGEPPIMNQ